MLPLIYVSEGKTLDVRENPFDFTVRFAKDDKHPPEEGSVWKIGKFYTHAAFDEFISAERPSAVRIIFDEQEELEYLVSRLAPFVTSLDVGAKHSRAFDLTPLERCGLLESIEFNWNTKQRTLWDVKRNTRLKVFQMMDYYSVSDFSALRGSSIEDLRLYGCNGMGSFTSKLHISDLSFILDMPNLTSLDLDIVKDESSEYYLTLLSKCKDLTHLYLTGSFFTFSQYAWLKAQLPSVTEGLEGVISGDFGYWIIGKKMPKNLDDAEKAEAYREKYAALVEEYKSRPLPPPDNEKVSITRSKRNTVKKALPDSTDTKSAVYISNYEEWQKTHARAFGDIFSNAFLDSPENKLHLNAALISVSQRKFNDALPKLAYLASVAESDADRAAAEYFLGLDYELLGNTDEMEAHYEALRAIGILPTVSNIAFHPYYRTAKFAQRSSECTRAIYYYRRALEFYDGVGLDRSAAVTVSTVADDIATTYLYMHRYSDAEKFIALSKSYDASTHLTRDFITAILYAVRGDVKKSCELSSGLPAYQRDAAEKTADAILTGTELHYREVPQDRSLHSYFWNKFSKEEKALRTSDNAEFRISELLTNTLGFMQRKLECRVLKIGDKYTVKCKNYFTKTLISEYRILFAGKPAELSSWEFVSVSEFNEQAWQV